VRNLLEMIYEHQLLRSKERNLDIPLDDGERVRLLGLRRLLQGEVPDTRQRELARVRMALAVQFTRPGGFEAGEIRNVSGGGFMILARKPQEVGTRIIVRIEDARTGTEYVFPCVVRWRSSRGPGRMGLELDGVPNRSELFEEASGVWSRSLSFGAQRSDPMVA